MGRSESPSISVCRRGSARGDRDCTVVWVRGEHDLATKVTLAVAIARAARLDDAPVLVDLSTVTFMDASTVGAIVRSRDRLMSRGQLLEVRAPSPPALSVLELCGLADLIHRQPRRSTDVASALSTWVDVPPTRASATDSEAEPVTARPGVSQSDGELVAAHVQIEDSSTAIEVDGPGP